MVDVSSFAKFDGATVVDVVPSAAAELRDEPGIGLDGAAIARVHEHDTGALA